MSGQILTIPHPAQDSSSPHQVLAGLSTRLQAIPPTNDWAIQAVDLLLHAGYDSQAADLHLDCRPEVIRCRFRVRGGLTPPLLLTPPTAQASTMLVGRLKVLARLPAYVIHEPQDGRLDYQPPQGSVTTLRVAFLPTPHGCLSTIRYPMRESGVLGTTAHGQLPRLDRLGMPPAVLHSVERLASARDGMLVLTGPAGSGKTTTLHAILVFLDQLLDSRLQMVAIEDPVERELPFATHVQIHLPTGLDFHTAARACLRHSPDVLLIGELRDPETVLVALSAGMSGHLVLTTLHAGRAHRVPGRLRALGAPPHLIASAFNGAVAQRLVPTSTGQVPLFETLEMDEESRALLGDSESFQTALSQIRLKVKPTLEEHGQDLVGAGLVSESALRLALGPAQIDHPESISTKGHADGRL